MTDLTREFLAAYFAPLGLRPGAYINAANNRGVVTVNMRSAAGGRAEMQMSLDAFRGFLRQAEAALRELEK